MQKFAYLAARISVRAGLVRNNHSRFINSLGVMRAAGIHASFANSSQHFFLVRHASTSSFGGNSDVLNTAVDSAASNALLSDSASTILEAGATVVDPSLASVGLGGNFPPGWIQTLLEYLHGDLGLSWCAAIVLTTVTVRTLTLPIYIRSRKMAIHMSNHSPVLARLQRAVLAAQRAKRYGDEQRLTNEYEQYRRVNKLSPLQYMFPVLQAPFFLTVLYGVRDLASVQLPSMTQGGAWWFTNLCESDPYCVLPLLTAGTLLLTLESGAEGAAIGTMNVWVRWSMRAFCVASLGVMWCFPAALNLYWLTSNLISLGLVAFLRIPPVKKALLMPSVLHHDSRTLDSLSSVSQEAPSVREVLNSVRERRVEADRRAVLDELARRAAQQHEKDTMARSSVFSDADAEAAYNEACKNGDNSVTNRKVEKRK